jgi:hypothetical protein
LAGRRETLPLFKALGKIPGSVPLPILLGPSIARLMTGRRIAALIPPMVFVP